MSNNWEKIYGSLFLYQVEVLKSVLLDHNIPAVVINKRDSAYLSFGEIELYTQRDYVVKALQIIKSEIDTF